MWTIWSTKTWVMTEATCYAYFASFKALQKYENKNLHVMWCVRNFSQQRPHEIFPQCTSRNIHTLCKIQQFYQTFDLEICRIIFPYDSCQNTLLSSDSPYNLERREPTTLVTRNESKISHLSTLHCWILFEFYICKTRCTKKSVRQHVNSLISN